MERNIGDQLNKAFEAYRQVSIEKDNVKKELQQKVMVGWRDSSTGNLLIRSVLSFCSCLIELQTRCQDNNLYHIFTDWILRAIHSKTSEADRGAAAANFRARSEVISNEAASRLVEWTPSSLCCQHVFVQIKTVHQLVLLPPHWTVDFRCFVQAEMKCEPCNHLLDGAGAYRKMQYLVCWLSYGAPVCF